MKRGLNNAGAIDSQKQKLKGHKLVAFIIMVVSNFATRDSRGNTIPIVL